jgi:hypothetical protein
MGDLILGQGLTWGADVGLGVGALTVGAGVPAFEAVGEITGLD